MIAQPSTSTRLVPLGAHRWRVLDRDGAVRGLIIDVAAPGGTRFCARRFHPASRTFRDVGEFWSMAEAAETLRLSR